MNTTTDNSCRCAACSTALVPDAPTKTSAARSAKLWLPFGVALLLAVAAEITHHLELPFPGLGMIPGGYLSAVLACVAIGLSGLSTFKQGWLSVIRLQLNMNALMSIAVTGALALQYWSEAAMVMVLFSLSERIEELSVTRAGNAIKKLLDLSPETALVLQSDGQWAETPVRSVPRGTIIKILAGERVPLDGQIQNGVSMVDQSPLTGESIPQEKHSGDQVFAGTINQDGVLVVETITDPDQTELANIIRVMKQAQASKSPTERFVDVFASYYTPLVVVAAIVTAVAPPIFAGADWGVWLYRALVLLIISCPCALVISTPITVVNALTAAARAGIIIKGGVFLESAAKTTHVAFDKTGTLTEGQPAVERVHPFTDDLSAAFQASALLGAHSTHPLARAVAQFANTKLAQANNGQADPTAASHDAWTGQTVPGRGITGSIGGCSWAMGSARFLAEQGIAVPDLDRPVESTTALVYVARGADLVAVFELADSLKPSSTEALRELERLGICPVLLSGDVPGTVAAVAASLAIKQAHGGLLPRDKVQWIQTLQHGPELGAATAGRVRGKPWVAMVGDGINDGPSLVQSDLGIAMGALGTGVAVESASVVLMDDDLRKIPFLIRLSQKTRRVLFRNIALALGIKAGFFALTWAGYGSMWMAVFADMGVSLIVVFLGMRLLRFGRR